MKTLVSMVHGSHLYGLNTENSDTDYKGVYAPHMDDVLLGTYAKELNRSTGDSGSKNTKDDIDNVIFSLPKFLKMACEGDTVAMDMLHCDNPITTSPEWEFIRENRHRFYTKNMKAFIGYARKQAAKYGIKGSRLAAIEDTMNYLGKRNKPNTALDHSLIQLGLEGLAIKHPDHIKVYNGFEKNGKFVDKHIFELCGSKYDMTSAISYVYLQVSSKYEKYGDRAKQAKENKGIDWKALSHALRAAYQLEEIYLSGDLKYPLKDRTFLLEVKKGLHDYTTVVAPALEKVIDDLEVLSSKSKYPEKVDKGFWDKFLLDVYKGKFDDKSTQTT